MTFKPLLIVCWLLAAAITVAAVLISAPNGERVPQLIGFSIGMAFWGAWRLGDVMSRSRASPTVKASD